VVTLGVGLVQMTTYFPGSSTLYWSSIMVSCLLNVNSDTWRTQNSLVVPTIYRYLNTRETKAEKFLNSGA